MSIQDVIAIAVAAGALFFVLRALRRQLVQGGCGGTCKCSASKSASESAAGETASTASAKTGPLGIVRHPFVPLNQLGLPAHTPTATKPRAKHA